MNLYNAFKRHFPTDQSSVLMTTASARYCYRDAEQESAKIANYFIACGLKTGDRVTVQIDKSPPMLWLYLATLRAGLVYQPLNTAYTHDELSFFIHDAEPSLIVCDTAKVDDFKQLCSSLKAVNILTLNADGKGSLIEASTTYSSEFATLDCNDNATAALLYSSGTTGRPKGILLSHKNLLASAQTVTKAWQFASDDCLLHALPIFHVHGLFVAIGCVLLSGSRMHWLAKYDVDQVVQSLSFCTVMMGIPTFYIRLLEHRDLNRQSCASMRLFICGSAPLLAEHFDTFKQRTSHDILDRYGMTETGMLAANPYTGKRKAGTVGLPLPGVSIKIDPADLDADSGQIGTILVKGDSVFSNYWRLPDKTLASFTEDGFFITGDQGYFDGDGYLNIVGRSKDMIICGGLNVYPKELELIIDRHPLVEESAVIGLPHADFGEVVAAVVVAKSTLISGNLIDYMKQRVANFKVPKQVFVVDELPRNSMGKVQKALLQQHYSQPST